MFTKTYSLRQRLLIGLGIVSFLYWSAMAAITIQDNVDEIHELYDVRLAHTALALLRITDLGERSPVTIPDSMVAATIEKLFNNWPDLPERQSQVRAPSENSATPSQADALLTGKSNVSKNVRYGKNLRYQVWRDDGTLMFRSANAPETAMTDKTGFSETQDLQGRRWLHYSTWDRHHDVRVVVSEAHDLRTQLVLGIVASSVSPLALSLPVLIFLLWLSVKRGLAPLTSLSREIAARKPDNLALLDDQGVPSEMRPIVSALNGLLQRMADTLENEREFTDNAAHELRTPLAAIQAQLYATRKADNEEERLRAMDQLQRGVERGIRLVGQLLTLARLDPQQTLPDVHAVHLGEVAEVACAELAPLALHRNQTLDLSITPELPPLMGNADVLAMLIFNLVDNAIRYTGQGGVINVSVRAGTTGLRLEVSDNGPGIAIEQRERVFERFSRIAGQDQPGTGLGLTICRRIAELHHATISLSDGAQICGLTVSVEFST